MHAIDLNPDRPEFTTAIRGYDRPQVDDYIERMLGLVAEAEERARAAESELEFSRHSTVGPRVTEIFELAIAEAKEIRDKTRAECEQTWIEARADAERLVGKATDEAAEVRERSDREREEALAELEVERRRAENDVTRLAGTKETMLAELRRLQEALAAAAGLGEAVTVSEPPEAATEETGELQTPARERTSRRAKAA